VVLLANNIANTTCDWPMHLYVRILIVSHKKITAKSYRLTCRPVYSHVRNDGAVRTIVVQSVHHVVLTMYYMVYVEHNFVAIIHINFHCNPHWMQQSNNRNNI